MPAKPSIVFAHVLWADGSCYSKVIPALQDDGYEVVSAQRQENHERVEVGRAAHHQRVQHVVLDLLVGQECDRGDDAGGQQMAEREQDGGDAGRDRVGWLVGVDGY